MRMRTRSIRVTSSASMKSPSLWYMAWGLTSKQFNYVHGDSHVAAAKRKSLLLNIGAELAARGKLQLIF